jgi:SAM-dependent methyltransferase
MINYIVRLLLCGLIILILPNYLKGIAECRRVLKPGGTLLATIPFHSNSPKSISRAHLTDWGIQHLLPPQYHGNPVSQEGSLVFTDFGWDLIDAAKRIGFKDASIDYYLSQTYGHLGEPLGVFCCK